MVENIWLNAIYSVTPTAVLAVVFWLVMRSVLRADRAERDAYADILREERQKRGLLDQREQDGIPDTEAREGHQ